MSTYKRPGVFIEEVSTLPPSVVPVETAIPAFIGYTENLPPGEGKAFRINSLTEYHALFGGPSPEVFLDIAVSKEAEADSFSITSPPTKPKAPTFWLYYQLQMFYANGGGPCYIISVGDYTETISSAKLTEGLDALRKEDEPTLILLPDLPGLPENDFYNVYKHALAQCAALKDRFTIIDLFRGNEALSADPNPVKEFRNKIDTNHLNYGAAYYPWLETTLKYSYDESKIEISKTEEEEITIKLKDEGNQESSLFHIDNGAYSQIKRILDSFRLTLPPSGAIAGIYAQVDSSRGVFKAPANVSLNNVIRPSTKISNVEQEGLNVHSSGKSINAIRSYTGKGTLVWGARTLDGNSNEFRYISVRRFFIFAEESIGKTIERFVFEPNNSKTWIAIKGSIENFLTDQWRAGALVGNTPQQAFSVKIGLGETMTSQDILEGKLVVVVGMAAVRPAEFIILRFTHKLQEA